MADNAGIRRRWLAKLAARKNALAARVKERARAQVLERRARKAVADAQKVLKRHPVKPAAWHPGAERNPYPSAGPFVAAGRKIVWHTTEGFGLPAYTGSAPHFTLDPRTGKLWQHLPVNEAARALEHPAGTPETNRAGAIQVELIGFAKDTGDWPAGYYEHIAKLARWIEFNAGVPRRCGVQFVVPAKRMGGQEFVAYAGHCGHCHVPNNSHWDPGRFRIKEVL